MLISMHVIIGKANEYFSVWMKISPGNLPNGNFLKNGKKYLPIKILPQWLEKVFALLRST